MDTARRLSETNKSKTKNYFIFYSKTGALRSISRKTFKSLKNCSFFKISTNYIKACGAAERKPTQSVLQTYFAEGLFDKVGNCFEGVKVIMDFLSVIGSTSKFVKGFPLASVGKCVSLMLKLLSVIRTGNFDVINVMSILVDIYYLVDDNYKAQSMDAFLLAGISLFLPAKFSDFLRKIQLFSNVKICDDYTLFYRFMNYLISVLDYLAELAPFLSAIVSGIKKVLEYMSLTPKHFYLYEMEQLITLSKNPKSYMDKEFRDKVFNFDCKIQSDGSLVEWARRSAKVKLLMDAWKRVVRIAHNQAAVIRKEPTAFILEGPPGCRKSVVMNRLIEALNEPCYSHLVKATTDGKDWYDCYNNETIFFMDDVGQQGASQWRTLINMVSPVRLPLDCAAAELKDTKFFNSEKIFITTNCFSNLGGLCKQDCISDVRALWRRGVVFDFANVKPQGDKLVGNVMLKHYDTMSDQWVLGPHSFVLDKIPRLRQIDYIHTILDGNVSNLVRWMMIVVKGYDMFKDNIKDSASIDMIEINAMHDEVTKFFAEGEDPFVDAISVENDINSRLITSLSEAEIDDVISRMERDWINDNYSDPTQGEVSDLHMYGMALANNNERPAWSYVKKFSKWIMSFFSEVWQSFIQEFFIKSVRMAVTLYEKSVSTPLGASVMDILLPLVISTLIYSTFICIVVAGGVVASKTCEIVGNVKDKFCSYFSKPWRAEMCKFSVENVHNSVLKVSNHSYRVVIETDAARMETHALISGRTILVPSHSLIHGGARFISIRSRDGDSFIVEHERVELVYINHLEDIAVLKLPSKFPSPFKKISQWFKDAEDDFDFCSYLISVDLITPLSSIGGRHAGSSHKYYINNWSGCFSENDLMYDVHGEGMCGSIVFSTHQGIRGMHVAGNEKKKAGVAKLWSRETIKKLRELCDSDSFLPDFVLRDNDKDESVIRIEPVMQTSTNTMTEFGPSPLYGIFPPTRGPANLLKYGRKTVKVVATKSFGKTNYISNQELEFGKAVLRRLIPEYTDISEKEVVMGNEYLAPLNKDSSNGLGCEKGKDKYVNFEVGEYTPLLKDDLALFRSKVETGVYPVEALLWSECLKDELRNDEKDGVPRSFRISTVHNQVLCKEKFGDMVAKIMAHRYENGVMIGVNPFKEWDKVYSVLKTCRGCFSADTKLWDGGMLPQVQRAVVDVILEKYTGPEKEICEVLLESLVHTILMIMDEGFITTHSFPSGHYLTAIMNSLVNRFYTACWYFRVMSHAKRSFTVSSFLDDVVDFVYGDDKLNGIRSHSDILNAISMREFFRSIGLDLTNADKSEIKTPFNVLDDLDFLKRKFVYHNDLGRIMCPLSLRTLQSGLSYVNLSKDVDQVMRDKVHNYVREIYLHPNYKDLRLDFEHRLAFRGFDCELPSDAYLYQLYASGDLSYDMLYM